VSQPLFNSALCVTTPRGRGAVATISVTGIGLDPIVLANFRPQARLPDEKLPVGRIVFGRWCGPQHEGPGEELVVCRLSETCVDIHCHGGTAAVEAITRHLMEHGVTRAAPGVDWLARVEPGTSPIALEARIALSEAITDRTAEILVDQWHGALDRAVNELRTLVAESSNPAKPLVDELLSRSGVGLHLTSPFRVAIFGLPNVGKSSLMNMLVGFERAIVFDQPGTTRDVLSARTAIDGWPVEFLDMAGLRETADPIEAAGVTMARDRLEAIDLGILVAEACSPWTPLEQQVHALVESPLVIYNKRDIGELPSDGRPPGLAVSARTCLGKAELLEAISRRLVASCPAPGDAVPFLPRHIAALTRVRTALDRSDCSAALEAIAKLESP
jgi:tRNA modification GTPase